MEETTTPVPRYRHSRNVLVENVEAMWRTWDEAVVLTDESGFILTCSPAFTALVGWSLDQLRGHKPSVYGLGLTDAALSTKMWNQLKTGQPWRGVLQNHAPGGFRWWGYTEIFPILQEATIEGYWTRVRRVFSHDRRGPTVFDTPWDGLTLHPVFQPLVTVSDGVPWAFEVLIRPQFFGQTVSPTDFYAMAESLDMVDIADSWALAAISRELSTRTWPRQYQLTLNVRMATLVQSDWLDRFLLDSGIPRDCVIIEISERDDLLVEIGGWGDLRERYPGIQFALDDWGSGHNDMTRLIDLHPEWLKVDRTWLIEAQHDAVAKIFLHKFAAWIKDEMRQTRVILEGIETLDDILLAQSCGITFGQGYFWGRPEPWSDIFLWKAGREGV
ncbi:MAG: EAL domain-containing protein [Firmicutes bacterium]|jgi:PAS domain S-box-containing protein|nr:EAL domain-containing protein [Bacillota bacterium]